MGCGGCNPFCGKCKPKMQKPIQCTKCKGWNMPVLLINNHCRKCGFDLSELITDTVIRCNFSGLLCTRPCGRHKVKAKDGQFKPCAQNTPPKTLLNMKENTKS